MSDYIWVLYLNDEAYFSYETKELAKEVLGNMKEDFPDSIFVIKKLEYLKQDI